MAWRLGVIIGKVGHVNYNVKIKDADTNRIIKSHANQIRERFINGNPYSSALQFTTII